MTSRLTLQGLQNHWKIPATPPGFACFAFLAKERPLQSFLPDARPPRLHQCPNHGPKSWNSHHLSLQLQSCQSQHLGASEEWPVRNQGRKCRNHWNPPAELKLLKTGRISWSSLDPWLETTRRRQLFWACWGWKDTQQIESLRLLCTHQTLESYTCSHCKHMTWTGAQNLHGFPLQKNIDNMMCIKKVHRCKQEREREVYRQCQPNQLCPQRFCQGTQYQWRR